MAEGEESSPQDEGEQGEGKKRIEAGEYRLKQQGEPGPADHDCQDQPDVVGLPHRRQGLTSPSSTVTKMMAITAYTTSNTANMAHTNDPGAVVTASSTRIRL